ncbi:hypothetical protein FRACYDRAFT_244775 [Fragilariopsis cylindrus CCMP1102]|uniref:F-box domain-containing protein n=1 Tax=Fragilariopsis cylindrus CCMP1102 TaxID=635003 RepID=A0A1E7F0J8_9STRA|nr:hypothetical protein FRACYDRAFT_244775 [Fragilariopsis cylindrus CCMP1102]|eukprot:OEU11657.1 hypothetical protein FRACYDRAFT_244775 [Fragilariopsis cylindrus CCMP1102]
MRRANTNNKNNNNRTRKRPPPPFLPPPSIIGDDIIAGRTRRQKRAIASKWDLQTPIIIEIISWLDQESLMNMNVVSKQLYDIITTNEPGNKNEIHPIFETKNKLQRYQIMRFKDISKFKCDKKIGMVKNIQMNGITSLYLSTSSKSSTIGASLAFDLPDILPKLQELDLDNIADCFILKHFSRKCPLLEKVTSYSNRNHYHACGFEMQASKNLKEIYMNNSIFSVWVNNRKISDLNNDPDIFMFHNCCKALERVSIRYMNWKFYFPNDFDDNKVQKLILIQNILIKFVLNAPPTLHWFRSDLTPDNMTMLRMERPGIELLR